MYFRNKADFNNYLKKAQKDSYCARQVSDILSKGDNSIGVKKDLKKAIKICQHWEKKKDYTGEKQYFLYYRLEKFFKELGKDKDVEHYHELYCYEEIIRKDETTSLYALALKDYISIQLKHGVDSKGKITNKARFANAYKFLTNYLNVATYYSNGLSNENAMKLIKVLSDKNQGYYYRHLAHYIGYEFRCASNVSLTSLTNQELENYINFLSNIKEKKKDLLSYLKVLKEYNVNNPTPQAIYDYGKYCLNKNSFVSYDFNKGFELINKAYELGYSQAYIDIVNHYKSKYDYDNAIKTLKNHIKKYKNDEEASLLLADIYFSNGNKNSKYYTLALEIYEKYVDKLSDERINNISKMYLDGLGVDVDLKKAKQYSKSTSTAKAILKKELAIFDTLKVKDKIYEEEIKELKQYLTTDDIDKLFRLYAIIRDHRKVHKNDNALFKLANLMLEKGKSAKAYNAMANCYMSGSGVEKNEELFEKYCKMAMDLNHAESYNLYYIYLYQKKDNSCLDYLNKAVELGSAAALYNLAQEYMFGGFIEKDEKKAVELLEKALSKEYYTAAYPLGSAYQFGKGVEENQEKAFEYYKIAADKDNHPRACYRVFEVIKLSSYKLGNEEEAYSYLYRSYINDCDWSFGEVAYAYYRGIVFKKDLNKYLEACKKGFDIKDAYCINEIADLYYYGNDELKYKVDYKKAFELYTMAYEKGNLYSTNKIAEMYIKGRGVKVDYNLAYKYAKEALDKNYNRANWTMGILYHYGYGVNKDVNKALQYYKEAYKNSKEDFIFDFARLHVDGIEGALEPDYNKAIKLFNEYILNNPIHYSALYNISLSYHKLKDYENAFKYIKKALAVLPKKSLYNRVIAYYYKMGLGVEKDLNKAIKHYEVAHEQGDVFSTFEIGMIYRESKNSVHNSDKALDYLTQAANKGHKEALGFLADIYIYYKKDYKKAYDLIIKSDKDSYSICGSYGDLFYNGYYVPRDYDEAFKWYMKSFELGKTNSIYHRLGRCYYFGHGVNQDKDKAKEYMYISVQEDYEPAKRFYDEFFKNN